MNHKVNCVPTAPFIKGKKICAKVRKYPQPSNFAVLLALGAVVMVFPFFYMVMTSFMTKNQYLSGQLRVIPDPWVWGKYSRNDKDNNRKNDCNCTCISELIAFKRFLI